MATMVRKQVYLERRQVHAVQQRAEALGINDSEFIRQAIDRELYGNSTALTRPDPAAWQAIETFLAAQADQPLSGEPYQFNREELYDERMNRFDGPNSD